MDKIKVVGMNGKYIVVSSSGGVDESSIYCSLVDKAIEYGEISYAERIKDLLSSGRSIVARSIAIEAREEWSSIVKGRDISKDALKYKNTRDEIHKYNNFLSFAEKGSEHEARLNKTIADERKSLTEKGRSEYIILSKYWSAVKRSINDDKLALCKFAYETQRDAKKFGLFSLDSDLIAQNYNTPSKSENLQAQRDLLEGFHFGSEDEFNAACERLRVIQTLAFQSDDDILGIIYRLKNSQLDGSIITDEEMSGIKMPTSDLEFSLDRIGCFIDNDDKDITYAVHVPFSL